MKRNICTFLLLAAAIFIAACGGAANAPVNNTTANTNAAKPTPPTSTKDILFDMDKKANEAWIKGDTKYFDGFLSDKFVSYEMGHRGGKADTIKMMGDFKCDVKTWNLEDPQLAMINADTAVISYKGTFDGTCAGADGQSVKLPSPIRAASIYARNGDKWEGVFHGENMIIDSKNPPPAADKKAEPKKEEVKKDDKPAANNNSAVAAKPVADANTEALVKLHTSGWEAFKAKDAKKFEELLAPSFAFVDPAGTWINNKADVIKTWTADMICEGIKKVKVSGGVASAISPTVELLTLKGYADGTCDGQKNGTLNQTAVYVKEGDAWKLAFMFESAAM